MPKRNVDLTAKLDREEKEYEARLAALQGDPFLRVRQKLKLPQR